MTNKPPSKKRLASIRRLSQQAQSTAKGTVRKRSRDPDYERWNGDRSAKRTPSMPPLPWKD